VHTGAFMLTGPKKKKKKKERKKKKGKCGK
jgi:hypothetical protein